MAGYKKKNNHNSTALPKGKMKKKTKSEYSYQTARPSMENSKISAPTYGKLKR